MANVFADRVVETTQTTGTGTLDLDGASTGFRTFVAGIGDGNTAAYVISDGVEWETGTGVVTDGSPDTLSRVTVLASSNGGSKVNWTNDNANERDVFCAPLADLVSAFSAGTLMLFQQTAAPTGWTKETTHNNKSLRVVTGSVSSGGATAFTSVFGSGKTTGAHELSIAEMPAHTHVVYADQRADYSNDLDQRGVKPSSSSANADTSSTGGGGTHTHTLSLDLQYVDMIIAIKD